MPKSPRGRNDMILPVFFPAQETKDKCTRCTSNLEVTQTCKKMIWKHCLPYIQIRKPRSDLCYNCVKLRDIVSAARAENGKRVWRRGLIWTTMTHLQLRGIVN